MDNSSGVVGDRIIVTGMSGSEEYVLEGLVGKNRSSADPSRPPLLEAGMGEALR